MNSDYFGLMEMVFSFGVVIGLAFWELRSVKKAKKKNQDAPPSDESE